MRPAARQLGLAILLLLLPSALFAHIGSPNVFFDGQAGPWPVRVIIRPPEVIPGVAEITVRLKEGGPGGAEQVAVQPIHYRTGIQGAPPPEAATPVPGAPGTYSGQLWLMVQGSYSIRVQVQGPAGTGEALVPVTTAPMELKGMQPGLGLVLSGLGLFLFAGAVTLAGAAVRESVLAPGETADGKRRRTARVVMVGAGIFLALVLGGGRRWWSAVEAEARDQLYKPFPVVAAVTSTPSGRQLNLQVQDDRSRDWAPLMPDHGKLMHLFLLREPGLDAFAHLHPVPVDARHERFQSPLPPLPPGRYRLYADIVHESGFPQTLTTAVTIPGGPGGQGSPASDPDDSWDVATPGSGTVSPLADGGEMIWLREGASLKAGQELDLRFQVKGPDGRPATLEPYMGMLGHAVVTRDDGAVFVHLHPVGSFAMAAQQVFESQRASEATEPARMAMDHSAHAMHGPEPGLVSFPYELPKPGRYRLWVQVKSEGAILTGSFAAEVAP